VSEFFTLAVLTATVASGIRLATPFLLASLGETTGQNSGVLNLGVDGIMLLGRSAGTTRSCRRTPSGSASSSARGSGS
jgi:simple sugar transport system permease protein